MFKRITSPSTTLVYWVYIEKNILDEKKSYCKSSDNSKVYYLEDYQTFFSYFTSRKYIISLIFNVTAPTVNEILPEVDNFTRNRSNDGMEFDWEAAIIRKIPMMQYRALSFSATQVIRKFYEFVALIKLSPQFVDKLTKDVVKSSLRHLELRPFSFYKVSELIFSSALHNNSILYLSQYTWDVTMAIWESNQKRCTTQGTAVKVFKNFIIMFSRWLATSAGFSVGFVLCPIESLSSHSAFVCALIFELGALELIETLLGNE